MFGTDQPKEILLSEPFIAGIQQDYMSGVISLPFAVSVLKNICCMSGKEIKSLLVGVK